MSTEQETQPEAPGEFGDADSEDEKDAGDSEKETQ